MGSDDSDIDVFIDQLHRNFKIAMGTLSNFLGMQIEQHQDGILVCQCAYMEKVLERPKMYEANPVAMPCDHSRNGTEGSVGRHAVPIR
jgi:hypothetical protein